MVLNQQRQARVSKAQLETFLARVRRRLRLDADAVTVCLVSDARIAAWNRAYRGKSKPTDVLSFPADAGMRRGRRGAGVRTRREKPRSGGSDSDGECYLGDIAIAPAVAKRNARRFGRSVGDEMKILVLHGVLHLMGYDHETDRGQMERFERRLRRELRLA